MYAMLITPESLPIVGTMDPNLADKPEHELVGNYLVFDRRNNPRYVVKAERFEEFFEIKQQDITVSFMKVKRK